MSTLVIDTDELMKASDSLQTLGSQISNMINTVTGFDVGSDGEFDFASAKNAIIHNLEACATKLKNGASYLSTAANAHSQLQNGLKFNPEKSGSKKGVSSNTNTNKNSSRRTGSSSSSSSTGNSYYSGGSGGPSYVTASTPVVAGTTSSAVQKRVDTSTKEEKTTEVKANFNKVGYATYNSGNMTDETKKITEHENFSYDEDGYAKLDGKYVITCDSSIGKIGDVLRFTLNNGETVECVIGVATVGSEYKDTINFMIDEKKASDFKPKDFSKNIVNNTEKVENIGSCIASSSGETSNEVANKAVEWAKSIAANDSIGYVNGGMGTNGGYDCTQFVQAAYNEAGIDLSERGNHNQTTIVEYLQGKGFSWHPGSIDPNELQAGDILVNRVHHAEMYIGDGMKIGAHNDWDGAIGDSSGAEISIDPYSEYDNGGWDGYLRYEGK